MPLELVFAEETETNITEEILTKDEAIKEAKRRSDEKINLGLKKGERILKSTILQTSEFENYVNVVVFYKVYEKISMEREITTQDVEEFQNKNTSN